MNAGYTMLGRVYIGSVAAYALNTEALAARSTTRASRTQDRREFSYLPNSFPTSTPSAFARRPTSTSEMQRT